MAGESSVAEARVGEGELVDVAGGEGSAVGEGLVGGEVFAKNQATARPAVARLPLR